MKRTLYYYQPNGSRFDVMARLPNGDVVAVDDAATDREARGKTIELADAEYERQFQARTAKRDPHSMSDHERLCSGGAN